ncbi:MAG TPA: hypothetical protein VN031_02010 [Candidatus Microsaccharimonas sp.]|nr:hypothetical protein [Candidatus Microsaccharimonas sp.]
MRARNQTGFAVVETLLVLVIIAMVAGTAYFVWHAQRNADASLNAANSSASKIVKSNKPTAQGEGGPGLSNSQQYLTIKEWGVRMKLNASQSSLYYKVSDSTPNIIYLSFRTITAVAPDCTELAAVSRLTQAEQASATAQPSDMNAPGSIKIDSYWYGYEHSHADCTDGTDAMRAAVEKAQPSSSSDLYSIFKTLEAV